MRQINIYTDGASRSNPGPAAIGIVLTDESGNTIETYKEYLGVATNNEAEYTAIIEGLKRASKHKARIAKITSDSQLVVRQMLGEYQVREPHLRVMWQRVKEQEAAFEKVEYAHARRSHPIIAKADALCNQALDEHLKKHKH
ncbi:reverse transcriptase-like protein [Candidatus Woesearchaeota archaeon]|nr:MAG: reverse transcriptase-like protein [Candidatus Woesearchaeota archaeon]